MTFVLLAVLAFTVVAFVWHSDRKDQRHDKHMRDLYQRLQAPELAVVEHVTPEVDPPDPVDLTDDDAYWESRSLSGRN